MASCVHPRYSEYSFHTRRKFISKGAAVQRCRYFLTNICDSTCFTKFPRTGSLEARDPATFRTLILLDRINSRPGLQFLRRRDEDTACGVSWPNSTFSSSPLSA